MADYIVLTRSTQDRTNKQKVVDEIIRANTLAQLEGPGNVGEFGENGEFHEVVDEMIRANKLKQLEGPRNVGNLAKTANLVTVAILAKFRQGC